ncbi:tRNA lysidine(34) synthetase TilS [Limimaricola pyoseonensis]|uniref:tRNA(Ile)-lysidine synthase n=1 Tax=Limimaricola pyoseonensis TaxID=521013 RepID=A0A1G7D9Z3_9RHOB|nr:tRNA lysidine(34) synthetase TilS [Limimaricola pyoseonensis]SDE48377.1 tRNA(Ile)-lysidine synthase [Limimaricola pyoseonensis]
MTGGAEGPALRATAILDRDPPRALGLAVSGGGDSVAMLHLLAPAARARGIGLHAATVDHGLRPEARDEARRVARACAALGVPHDILEWTGWDGRGNLQDAARRARRALLTDWAAKRGLDAVALGHTRDDQAETVLMRLARGSGVDGLAAMAIERREAGLRWLRPLLGIGRAELRDWLTGQGIGWDEDPSNEDRGFQRVRARDALAALAPLGLEVDGLVATAERMAMARAALDALAAELSSRALRLVAGAVAVDLAAYRAAPEETRLRLAAAALRWIGGGAYRPRLVPLRAALEGAAEGRRRTLAGVTLRAARGTLWLCREPKAVEGPVAPDTPWDGRWQVSGPGGAVRLAALGAEGLRQCPGWRDLGLPRDALLPTPALWDGARLVAAPCAGRAEGWRARIVADFPYPTLPH